MSDLRPEPITVGRLRELLAAFDPETPVMVDGYEGGLDYPEKLRIADVCEANDAWYYGRFEEPWTSELREKNCFKVLVIPR